VKRALLPLLRSPADGSALELADAVEKGDEIVSGRLLDDARREFPIEDGVPLFAAELADDPTFDFKWKLIGDSYGHTEPSRTIRRQWYLDRFGYGTAGALHDYLRTRRLVLDGGTGSGVDTAMFAESGTDVVSIDLSRQAAQSVYRRLGGQPNVHVVQADLMHLPFARDTFDYVSSDQVIHHTPDARRTFASLTSSLAPGGRIAIYVYNRKGPIREFTDDFIRKHATKLSVEECFELSRAITRFGKALSDLDAEVEIPEAIPMLGIEAGRFDVQRLIYQAMMKCFWNDAYDFDLNVIVNFDWYHPKWASRHTLEEVDRWLEEEGLERERLEDVESGIVAVGSRSP
jgi:SAM-dependent methyltransferase